MPIEISSLLFSFTPPISQETKHMSTIKRVS